MNLEEIIAPLPISEFSLHLSDGRIPLYIPGGPLKFQKLFNKLKYWECIERGKPEGAATPRASLSKFQLPVAYERGAIKRAIRSGNTVCVSHIDRASDSLRALCVETEALIGFPGAACVHCYTSPPGTGYDFFHVDGGIAITLQIEGTKDWEYADTSSLPWLTRVGGYREPGRLEWFGDPGWHPKEGTFSTPDVMKIQKQTLKPGDLLVMPAGVWHRVKSTDQTSLSLNLKLTHTTTIDVIIQLLRSACMDNELWRRPLPFTPAGGQDSWTPDAAGLSLYHDLLLQLKDAIDQLSLDANSFAVNWASAFVGSQNEIVPQPDFTLIDNNQVFALPQLVSPRVVAHGSHSATILGQGRMLSIRGEGVANLLQSILRAGPFDLSAALSWSSASSFTETDVRILLEKLVRAGFLHARRNVTL